MEKIKILAIAPYHGLSEMIDEVCKTRDDVIITSLDGDLGAGLSIANEAVAAGDYDIILSRGGTADMLSREIDIPTFDISISLGDILQAIKLAENYSAKFAIVGFPSIAKRARIICNLLNYDISVRTVNDESEVGQLLTRLRDEGYKMCIGDAVTATVAGKCGLNSILITSSAESINTTIDQAVKINGCYARLRKRNVLYERALANADANVVVFDEKGDIRLSTLPDDVSGRALTDYLRKTAPTLWDQPAYRLDRIINDDLVSIDAKTDDLSGDKSLFFYITRKPVPPAFSDGGVTVLNASDAIGESFNRYYGFSGASDDMSRALERFAKRDTPIAILGEQGTGKDSVAAYLYSIGPYASHPLYTIDCALISDKEFVKLLRNPSSPLSEMGVTLYIKNFMLLNALRREQLISFIEQSGLHHRCRVIISFVMRGDDGATEETYVSVSARLGAVSLRLPPLRERKCDIPSISALYLSRLNASLGKQLAGLEPEALKMLIDFEWPYNLDQFHRVLRELASMTSSFYICADDVSAILRNEKSQYAPGEIAGINLNQSLDDITFDILNVVLHQENNNQKKTAERLKIGRSTIWRILKSRKTSL